MSVGKSFSWFHLRGMQGCQLLCSLLLVLLGSLAFAQMHDHHGVNALAGAGDDTTVVNAFFPERITIRVGETVTWQLNTDEIHTVTFTGDEPLPRFEIPVPDGGPGELMVHPQLAFPTRMPEAPVETYDGTGFVSSGVMSRQPAGPDAPPNSTFSVTFTEPGTYVYYCAIHPEMRGIVEVLPEAAEVPTQADIDAQAEAEMATFLAMVEAARVQSEMVRSEPGPNGTTIWFVRAGALDAQTGDVRAQAYDFLPENLTIQAGDTVVWNSLEFHTVTFSPLPPGPEFIIPTPQEEGPPLLLINPEVVLPAKPAGVYDETQYFNSGLVGRFSPFGLGWALTFDTPGTYEYVCVVHREQGMVGTITVVARE
jgi:plastocyanin